MTRAFSTTSRARWSASGASSSHSKPRWRRSSTSISCAGTGGSRPRPSVGSRTWRSLDGGRARPKAHDGRIDGDFTGWSRTGIPLWDEGHGWGRTSRSSDPGADEYRPALDGDRADPEEAGHGVKNLNGG